MIHVDIRFIKPDALGRSNFKFATTQEIAANISGALNSAQNSGNEFVSFQMTGDEWIIIRRDNISSILIEPEPDKTGGESE